MKKIFQKNIVRKRSSCLIKNFNGFNIVRIENERTTRKRFCPFDVIYKPKKKWIKKSVALFNTKEFSVQRYF